MKVEAAIERLNRFEATVLPELAEFLRNLQNRDLAIKTKRNARDLVTVADLESEKRIVSFIRAAFPEDDVLAEEGGGDFGEALTWVIDPVDGTVNYAHGLPLYAISIGLAWQGKPIAGLVHMPALRTTYRAAIGSGATCDGVPIGVTDTLETSQSLVVTGFPYEREPIIDLLMTGVRSTLMNCRGIRRTGSAAIDLCWLAHGRFDAHYELNLAPWDTCAGELIVREAGGRVTDLNGREHELKHKSLLATNGRIHEDMLRILSVFRSE
ncbi:MAG: inositol monophosphatase [Leptospirales bacterium]|nr:inositol monophosphatase [Leptospirales bacterium]